MRVAPMLRFVALCPLLFVAAACTTRVATTSSETTALKLATELAIANSIAANAAATPVEVVTNGAFPDPNEAPVILLPSAETAPGEDASDEGENEEDDGTPSADEGESHELVAGAELLGPIYSTDISDELLEKLWREAPEALGSVSFGFVDEGRLLNARPFPMGDAWRVVQPATTWGTDETIGYVTAAIQHVKAQFPDAPRLRVNAISAKEGGYCRPHKSHQSGRDVDLGFYYPGENPIRIREREKYIDVAKNWALVKALVTLTDVQVILLDRRVQKVLYDHALRSGENPDWLDSLFRRGRASIVQHARRHRDHFHVRFYNARSQELGRRLAPLLAQRPEQNLAMHRVRSGDTLGAIANRYGSTISLVRKANHMRGSFLRVAQVLKVPLLGPCTRCPVPPPVVVPARRLPPPPPELTPQAANEVGGHSIAAANR